VDSVKRVLRGVSSHQADAMLSRIAFIDNLLYNHVYPKVEGEIAQSNLFSYSLSQTMYTKRRVGRFLFALQFLNWDWDLAIRHSKRRLGADLREVMSAIVRGYAPIDKKLLMNTSSLVEDLAKDVWGDKSLTLKVVRPSSAFMNPIARRILVATCNYVLGGSYTGERVGVFAPLGCGKTTLILHSINSALRVLGMGEAEALEVTGKLVVNNPLEALHMMDYVMDSASTGEFLPAFAIDDAASLIPKYWYMGDPDTKRFVIRIQSVLKKGREGFGVFIIPSDTHGSIAKGVREIIDVSYEGTKVSDTPVTTLWASFGRDVGVEAGIGRKKKAELRKRVMEWIGTVHPPMYAPDPIYAKLTAEKLSQRKAELKEALELAEKALTKEKGKSKEEEEEEN